MRKIVYSPAAKNDLKSISFYISKNLHSPMSANRLLDKIEKSVLRLAKAPLIYAEYEPIKPLEDKYRIIPVENYFVLYVVYENVVEIRRVVYAKSDFEKII